MNNWCFAQGEVEEVTRDKSAGLTIVLDEYTRRIMPIGWEIVRNMFAAHGANGEPFLCICKSWELNIDVYRSFFGCGNHVFRAACRLHDPRRAVTAVGKAT